MNFKELGEQLLHGLWIAAPLFVIWKFGLHAWTGILAAWIIAAPREFVDQWPINDVGNTVKDYTAYTVSGFIMGLLGGGLY